MKVFPGFVDRGAADGGRRYKPSRVGEGRDAGSCLRAAEAHSPIPLPAPLQPLRPGKTGADRVTVTGAPRSPPLRGQSGRDVLQRRPCTQGGLWWGRRQPGLPAQDQFPSTALPWG